MPPKGEPTAAAATKNRPKPISERSQPRTYSPAAGRPWRVNVDSGATGGGGGGFRALLRGSVGGGGNQTGWSGAGGGGEIGSIGASGSAIAGRRSRRNLGHAGIDRARRDLRHRSGVGRKV